MLLPCLGCIDKLQKTIQMKFEFEAIWIVFDRLWFLRPILDLSTLNDRLDSVSFFHDSD